MLVQSRVQFQKRVVMVGFAGKQRFQFAFLNLRVQSFQRVLRFAQDGFVVFRFGQLYQVGRVFQFLFLR